MTHPLTKTAAGILGGAATRKTAPVVERPAPLRQAVFEALVEMIITRELEPGQHLVEKELADVLGVSRQPVREALQRMHTEGWVDLRPALGAFVHIPTESEADQLLAARSLLEAESARLAAEHATPEQIEHLYELQRIGEEALAVDDEEVLVSANASLHTHIVTMSGNKVLADLRASVEHRVRWYYLPIAFESRLGGACRVDRSDRQSRRRTSLLPDAAAHRAHQGDLSGAATPEGGRGERLTVRPRPP
jgi:DNA-binding GntR family transcriptional regulator